MSAKEQIDGAADELKKIRDELRLQVHLAKAEAQDEWEELEKKWQQLQTKASRVGTAGEETAEEVGAALSLAFEELKAGYERIRSTLSH